MYVDRGYDVLKTAGALLAAVNEAQANGLYAIAHLVDDSDPAGIHRRSTLSASA